MEQNINETVIYLLAGMKVKIKAPVFKILGQGWFPETGEYYIGGTAPRTPINGFVVEDLTVGTPSIEGISGEVAIYYHHKKAQENRIWFKAATGEMALCTISSVPLHDHSSIVQGGPAYGTYFSDDEADQNAT